MNKVMTELLESPFFGISLTIITYYLGTLINKKIKSPLCAPLLLSAIFTGAVITIFHIPMEYYNKGGDVITLFLGPATTVLGYTIYKQLDMLKKYFIPVMAGCLAGTITALVSVIVLSRLFGLNELTTVSIIPKSVTAPIAIEISQSLGGVGSITIAAVAISGITGAVFAPFLIKILRIKNKAASGVAIGTCSHAFGTSKALEIGEIEGAMSGIAIGITGIFTVIICLFL